MKSNPMTEAAKELRKKQTEAEKRLWFKLRDQQMQGIKFRRQEPIGNYIVDFVNFENKLVVEIDGSPHNKAEIKQNDRRRTLWLQSEGFKVLRFWNSDILDHVEKVLEEIKDKLNH